MEQKEINKIGYDRLLMVVNSIKEGADKNPDRKSDGYLLQAGLQQAYSHVWHEMQSVIEDMNRTGMGYINWKIFNLLIGFAVGGIFVLLILTL